MTAHATPLSVPLTGKALDLAREVLRIEADAVQALIARIDRDFLAAVQIILDCKGRIVVSGMGKSGHIARKIASTLASTGTPAFFVHPGEASHGDLGMITRDDVLLALHGSWNRKVPTGAQVVRIHIEGGRPVAYEDFISGWQEPGGRRWGRPADVLVHKDGSVLISDDAGGAIFRVSR